MWCAIALCLAASAVAGQVDAIDRDALAVAFTRHNARVNGLAGVDARGAIAYEHLPPHAYDAVASNLPAKAGPGVHRLMLLGAFDVLREGGEVWLVAVKPLAEAIDAILSDEAVRLLGKVPRGGHVVYHYGFTGRPALPDRPYHRADETFQWKTREYSLACLHGLGDFDTRGWASGLAIDLFAKTVRSRRVTSLGVCDPGQGHVPVLAALIGGTIERMAVVSRDLIALKATAANLPAGGYAGQLHLTHAVDPSPACRQVEAQVVLATLHEKEGMDVNVEKISRLLSAGRDCRVIAACKAAFGSRLREHLRKFGRHCPLKKKRKGVAAFCFE